MVTLDRLKEYHTDSYGRIHFDTKVAFELLMEGNDLSDLCFQDDADTRSYNARCVEWDKSEYRLSILPEIGHSPEEEHRRRQGEWLFPQEITAIDVREYLLGKCDTDAERRRINEEMDMFEERGLMPVLHLMIYLVHHFRSNNIVYGVGRGSSVSSFVLYKIGIHRVHSLRYGLDIKEFLK